VKHSILAAALIVTGAVIAPVILAAQLPVPPGPPVDPNAQFEAASIKPFDASAGGPVRLMMIPGRLEANGVPLRLLLRQALRVQDYQIIGVPDWANTERYSVVAKMPDGAPPNASPVMLANLFKDRFKLVMHTESRDMPIFNLVLARTDGRLGPNLKPTSAECQAEMKARLGGPGPGGPGGPGGAGRAGGPGGPPPPPDFNQPSPCGMMRIGPGLSNASGQSIAQLVQLLAQFSGRPVIDKTGLMGAYDFDLKWAPDPGGNAGPFGPPPPGAPALAVDPDAPNLYTAVQEQLGLKLENTRGPVDVIVIDRIERPSLD
jgi:uncharacterized protein (TIGR03435 family)